jgi:alpha-ketoglutarate-dependent taurine dioxygenase
MLSASRVSKKDLKSSVMLFQLILHMYNRQCVCEPARQVIMRVGQGLSEDKRQQYEYLKREYQTVRLRYFAFLEDYAGFARDLNRAFGESVAWDCSDRPDELSEPAQWIPCPPTAEKKPMVSDSTNASKTS